MCARHSPGHSGADGPAGRIPDPGTDGPTDRIPDPGADGPSPGGSGQGRSDGSREGDVVTQARGPVARAVERAILFYRRRISPAKGAGSCRFEPTCSAYGLEAVRRFGAVRGLWLTMLRVGRCAPWHPGGWDPVPRSYPGLGSWWRRMHE